MTLVDRCGDERTVECGSCSSEEECIDNMCQCPGESEQKLCDDFAMQCGSATVLDRCDDQRDIECGSCTDPTQDCIDNLCVCEPPSEAQLCDDAGFQCGTSTVVDECGDERSIDCGECADAEVCTDNACQCEGETQGELCEEFDIECGSTTVTDQCGDERSIDCGECSGPGVCSDNVCECEPESDQELCGDHCGETEVTDRCGDERVVDCGPCPEGDSTFGAVRDAHSGALIGDAQIRVYTWPPPEGASEFWAWPEGHREDDPDMATTTSTTPEHDYNYEFATTEPMCIDDQVATLEAGQWYRFVVERPGYRPGIFYRPHPGYTAGECPASCPVTGSSGCHRMDFEIWPDDIAHPQPPNLVVDPRDLQRNEWQCAHLPDDHAHDELIGLRIRAGAANVGQNHFHIEGTDVGGGQVVQHIHWSDGSRESIPINSDFEFHEGHQHIHFMDWFRLQLLDRRDECLDLDSRPSDCTLSDGLKISYCIHDLDPFDRDVGALFDGLSQDFPDPPTCDTTEQGVTQGWKDTYHRQLPGQVVIVGDTDDAEALDELWIEAEVDPDHVLEEVERYGNIAHVPVGAPSSVSGLCANPSTSLDCSMPPDEYTTRRQRRQCRDYLNF